MLTTPGSGGYVISAICVCIEYGLLGHVHRKHDHAIGVPMHTQHRQLIASFIMKLTFIVVEVALAVSFGATEYTGRYNQSAILEWIVALVYIFCKSSRAMSSAVTKLTSRIYVDVWSYVFDFLPAHYAKSKSHRFPPIQKGGEEMGMTNEMGGPAYTK